VPRVRAAVSVACMTAADTDLTPTQISALRFLPASGDRIDEAKVPKHLAVAVASLAGPRHGRLVEYGAARIPRAFAGTYCLTPAGVAWRLANS
jgi:hypothetical protein